MGRCLITYLFLCLCTLGYGSETDVRPRIISDNGQLIFMTAENRNISFVTGKYASVYLNGEDLLGFTHKVRKVSNTLERLELTELPDIQRMHQELQRTLVLPTTDYNGRISEVQQSIAEITARVNSTVSMNSPRLRRLRRKVNSLSVRILQIEQTLQTNDCSSNPCRNGGTCIDNYGRYQCLCPMAWEGENCETDVNECSIFAGTDLGCQNGATCINLPGTYRCECANGWYGAHCISKSNACSDSNRGELCGNGICISQSGTANGYSCICNQGWKSSTNAPACIVDVDECQSPKPPCSVAPVVQCLNTPGSYMCGPCPQGYSGNGHYCVDVDECQFNNGGCSQMPLVQCINTVGSRQCGPCPVGYEGDGVSCRYVGACSANNGGCHPLATCIDNPAISTSYVFCQCRPGYTGSGMGPLGCMPMQGQSTNDIIPSDGAIIHADPCSSNPCAATGTCLARATTFVCLCAPGYTGQRCEAQLDLCESQPCLNGGTCSSNGAVYSCICPTGFTGYNCETQLQTCGGFFPAVEGTISFPSSESDLYPHLVSCAWVITTRPGKVLNVTFTRFNIEGSTVNQCLFDWLQIHEGEDVQGKLLGKFCGTALPLGGNFNTTHDSLYLWFRSDHSTAGNGFQLSWNTIDPVCGGVLPEANHGVINSPSYPGKYPPNRDCYWTVQVPPGKRIQFTFATLQMEHHDNCTFDFLEVRDGSHDYSPLLGKFCSTGNPAPLITSGRTALVYFHSDMALSDHGFHITYASIPAIPGCGGLLTAPEGTVSSPNHPDSYDHNLVCEWIIRAPVGERLQLQFGEMQLEISTVCRFDYVEIRDGESEDSPSLGRFCGRNLPPIITSLSNHLFVKFRSDYSVSHGGFRARYSTICGGEFTAESGIIKSPFYPSHYPGNKECIFKIGLPPGRAVSLEFQELALERSISCMFDYLEIRDGDDSNSTLIGRYCGGPDRIPPPIVSTQNFLWLKFRTDSSSHDRGFYANYSSIDVGCGGIVTNSSGTIASPLHPQAYPHGTTCRWIIKGEPGSVIRLTFQTFSLERSASCKFDYVEVFDNRSVSMGSGRIGRFCGRTTPPVLTTVDNVMTVVFKADSSIAAEGFTAVYSILNTTHACGGDFYTGFGIISSPAYPAMYPANRDCVWTIYYRYGYQLLLSVLDFQLESHDRCSFDYLEIRNGKYATSPLIGRYCGTNIPPTIPSHGNQLYIRFVSDNSRSQKGFRISWEATATGCGGKITSPSGSIASPNYPQPPRYGVTCMWTITVSSGSKAQLSFSDLDMGDSQALSNSCMLDFVEVYDGAHSRSKRIGKYCGTRPPLEPIVGSGKSLFVKYISAGSVFAGRGFMARFDTNCNVELNGITGVIESPGFPYPYPHGKNCTWNIIAPIGNKVNLTFSHFDVESFVLPLPQDACFHDYVQVFEGKDTNRTSLGRFCGARTPPVVSSNSSQVQVRFESDSNIAGGGFRLEWEIYGCGGLLTKSYGYLRSPNYPDMYPAAMACIWQISIDHGSRIELTIQDFDIEGSINCQFDFLKVTNGKMNGGMELANLCNQHMATPIIVTSSDNEMTIYFHSDGSVRGRGFRASYKSLAGGCGGVFTSPSGSFHSPNYPNNYDHGSDCGWKITVVPNHVVELKFTDFDIEHAANCSYDYVSVHDGPSEDYAIILKHCGHSIPNITTIRSTSNEMFIKLVTDNSFTSKGFAANYSTVREGDSMDSPLVGTYCMTKIPPSIVSRGQALFIHLVNQRGVGAGFRATYSVIAGACGGNLTSEHGVFASPNYPDSYPPVAECVWTLSASPGNRVLLSFRQLSIETSEFYNNDYLEIRENNAIGPLIGHFCGSTIPTNITAKNRLWIKFRSDEEGTAAGFVADYSLVHGNELFANSGELASPLYPVRYTQHGEFTWRIVADENLMIALFVRKMRIEKAAVLDACQCSLTIYDGYDDSATVLQTLCGYIPPRRPIIASSNVIFVKFLSQPLHEGSEFFLNWEAWPANQAALRMPRERCGADIFIAESNTTSISTPGFPEGYQGNLYCYWTLTSPPHMRIQLRLDTVDVESGPRCLFDRLEVREYGRPIQRICRREQQGQILTTTSNRVRLIFMSDASLNFTGISLSAMTVCGGLLKTSQGIIESPQYPESYPAGASCEWIIRVRTGRTIEFYFDEMVIGDGSQDCNKDYIVFRNGDSVDSPFVGNGKYCGQSPPASLETSSNQLHVKFVADSRSRGYKGFRLRYSEKSLACGSQIYLVHTLQEMTIKSPNYPSPSTPNAECEWAIMSPPGTSVQLDFLDQFEFNRDLSCYTNGVEVRDGASARSNLLGKFCGTKPGTITSSSNALYIRFYTRASPKAGFSARLSIARCGGTVVGNRGVITSPNFPGTYEPNSNCTWHINGPDGHALNFYFTSIDLPAGLNCSTRDYVEIADANYTENTAVFCGQTVPVTEIETSSSHATVRFISDNRAESRSGFRLVYNASVEGCGGYLTNPEGYIQSPGYPNVYPNRKLCVWVIQVPIGRKIKLEFEEFSLQEKVRGYCRDFVSVHNSPFLSQTRYCGSNTPGTISSSSSKMVVSFLADLRINGRGFKARYTSDEPADCSGEIVGDRGYIASPGFENGSFPALADCTWQLSPTNANFSTLVLTLVTQEIDNATTTETCLNRNFLLLRIGERTNSYDIQDAKESCYTSMEPFSLHSPFREATVHFMAAGRNSFRGFNMTYQRYPCGGLFAESRNISSPNYPNNYPLTIDCVWLFWLADEGGIPKLTFNDFDVGMGNDCSSAYISVRNGHFVDSPEFGRYCAGSPPPLNQTLMAASSGLRIHFHVSADVPKRGFSAMVTSETSGCGGILHGPAGIIQSPSFPSRYPHNTECVWQVQADTSFRIVFSFTETFDLESSNNCQNDYVEISEPDDDGNSLSLGRFCGKQVPGTVVSNSNAPKITFRSNAMVNGDGFKISWARECGGIYSGPTGTISSPGFPDRYDDNLTCTYVINATSESYVLLSFEDPFELEGNPSCMYDSVGLYQGTGINGERLAKFCGNEKPKYVYSSKGPMTVHFSTDEYRNGKGFMAQYTIEECGGLITEPSIIKSPAHPNPYLHNINCTWTIQAPPSMVPYVKFEMFELESHSACRFDYVALYDGPISNTSLIGKYCGTFNYSLPRVKSRESTMSVNLVTDSSFNKGGFKAAVYFTYGENQGCGGIRNVTSTNSIELRSLDIDGNGQYEHNLDCQWIIIGEPGQVLRLQFNLMDIEESQNGTCHYDYIEVRDGMGPTSSLIGQYCGTTIPPAMIASSNFLFMRFISDGTTSRRGFISQISNTPPSCGSALPLIATNQTQELASPNYPNPYGSNLRCRYIIDTGDENSARKISLRVLDMNLESDCSKDRLEAEDLSSGYDGANLTLWDIVLNGDGARTVQVGPHQVVLQHDFGRKISICGSSIPHDIFSSGRSLSLTFVTDEAGAGRGFKLLYGLSTCNRTYYGPQGGIVGSNWPQAIPFYERCQMHIESEQNSTISIYFNYLRLKKSRNCTESYLRFYDGDSPNTPLLRSLCGFGIPNPIFSTGNRVYIEFLNSNMPTPGYDITYASTSQGRGCGGTLYNTFGSITSPFYPMPSNASSECQWDVSVPLGYHVKLSFSSFQVSPINDDGSCISDYVELIDYNPNTDSRQSRGIYCGRTPPAIFLGFSNTVLVRYVTSLNSTGTGWRATFEAVAIGLPIQSPPKP
ncbi:cubilin-like isoform X4 [Artemia franciscana]|uniref:cubilin-like isoform X4 n=1 Tax=Artemia franciscana TaxID=6661 RepID=UPI0032DA78FE